MTFYSRLNYSFGNEDWSTEQKALQINPDSRVLCITASGDRPFHLLMDNPKRLTTVDANPFQSHLLNLKRASLTALNFDEYIRFLGAAPSTDRKQAFKKVLSHLDSHSAKFWLEKKSLVEKGILYQGNIEKVTKLVAWSLFLLRPSKVRKLFEFDDLEEQRTFLSTHWDTLPMRKAFDVILSRFISKVLVIDPGLYANLDPDIKLGAYIYGRMLSSLHKCLAKENLLISLLFRGFVGNEAFPPYLKPRGSDMIKKRLSRLHSITDNVIHHMENVKPNTYDRFSLSDIASYMSEEDFKKLIGGIYHSAAPGARFCIRQFTSNYSLPPEFKDKFVRDSTLEKELEEKDRCFVYRFMVGQIRKT